jgi:hypothetical protein
MAPCSLGAKQLVKLLLQLSLLVVFSTLFGWPAIQRCSAVQCRAVQCKVVQCRYLEKQVRVLGLHTTTGGIPAPVITVRGNMLTQHYYADMYVLYKMQVVVLGPTTKNGWRSTNPNGNPDSFALVEPHCGHTGDIEGCIEKETFNESDGLKEIMLGFSAKTLFKNRTETTVDFTSSWQGRTYTMDIDTNISPDDTTTQMFLSFSSKRNYKLYIHDRDYFILNDNPYGLPTLVRQLYPAKQPNQFYRLALVVHEVI